MGLRKMNAGVGLLVTVLLLAHAISLAVWMLSRGAVPQMENYLPWILTGATVVHALVSIGLMISGHKGTKNHKSKKYPKMNAQTIIQRISGALMVLFTWLHIAGASGIMTPPQAVHAIVPPLFFILVMVHIAVSTGKAFITLGIGSAKLVKRADIAVKALCAVVLVADVIGFYLHVC
ncbi:MAG: hypothetical protein IKT47_05045 [Oscillospiraceae bacterium]|nr:hypothetical protein [Oscillospiraceae bacterium]